MEQPSVSKSFLEVLKSIRDDIHLVWNDMLERFQILHIDKRTGNKRILSTIEEEDGSFRHPDMRALLEVENIDFNMIDAYPDPERLVGELIKEHDLKKIKKRQYAEEYRKWWNKDMKTFWRRAIENAQRGIFALPEEREKKIIIT